MGRCCCCCGNQGAGNAQAEINYSFEEQFTGKHWIDGKKIYLKTIEIGNLPNKNATKEINHGISNIDSVIKFEGNAVGSDSIGKATLPLPLPFPTEGHDITLNCRESHIRVYTQTDYWNQFKGYVTIFYTCTDR